MTLTQPTPRIIVESKIPYIKGVLEPHADVRYLDSHQIDRAACMSADAPIVRTRTKCDRQLLEQTPVQLIATATIGTDHIDLPYCSREGIKVVNAPGCNAWAVVQWVVSALVAIDNRSSKSLQECTVGIVGAGQIGSRLADTLHLYGIRTLICDPPLAEEGIPGLLPLQRLAEECDIITFHVPYTRDGKHPTHHLASRDFFWQLRHRPYILNASRGGVVDDFQLLEAFTHRRIHGFCLDVYEDEPTPASAILESAIVSTPHIAGYSMEGKHRATTVVLQAVCSHFDLPRLSATQLEDAGSSRPFTSALTLRDLAKTFPIARDSQSLKLRPQSFEQLRNGYAYRHDFRGYEIGNPRFSELLSED